MRLFNAIGIAWVRACVCAIACTAVSAAHAGANADAFINGMWEFKQFGRVGSIVGCMGETDVCNVGQSPLDWDGPPGELHPFMVFNMYRLKDGRLQQIGQSNVKHGLGAAQNPHCDIRCEPHPNSQALGVGCADTYSANFNGNMQNFMGPRAEVNPWTGEWTYSGSHMATPHTHDGIAHRVQLHDNDLAPALNPGATYIGEIFVVAHDDINPWNSATWTTFEVSGAPGATWTFSYDEVQPGAGPAIYAWPDAQFTTFPGTPDDDGQAILAAKVSDNGNGTWRYEYAVYNHNMDRAIASFTLPISASVNVTDIGFHAIPSHGEPWSNNAWVSQRSGSTLIWSTDSYAENEFANAVRWGTMYNFWFDANAAPTTMTATLTPHKPGKADTFQVATQGPVGTIVPGDVTGDGIVNVDDLLAIINAWGPCPSPPVECPADLTADGTVNVDDLLGVINNWSA